MTGCSTARLQWFIPRQISGLSVRPRNYFFLTCVFVRGLERGIFIVLNILPNSISSRHSKKKIIRVLPDWLFSSIITLSDFPVAGLWKPLKMVQALAARNDFVEERLNALDRIVVSSTVVRSHIEHYVKKVNRIVDIPFGIDAPPIVTKDKSDVLRVGFIGTRGEHKGAHILTGAILSLPETMKVEARIYGDLYVFPEYSRLLNKQAYIDKRIKFCGTFQPDDINLTS